MLTYMDRPVTPLRAASFGVLLLALWLIVLGLFRTIELPFVVPAILKMGLSVTYVTIVLVVLWKILPLGIGIVLFQQHRRVVRLFTGIAVPKEDEQDSWNNTALLATLLVGLLGLFLAVRGLGRFGGEGLFMWLIIEIDNPEVQHLIDGMTHYRDINMGRLPRILPILYPLIIGLVCVLGARRIGNFIGHQIDKSLENPPDEKEKEGNL